MSQELIESMRRELEQWRSRLEGLRVRADLAEMELRERVDEFDRARLSAMDKLSAILSKGKDEWKSATQALEAGWSEMRRKYEEIKPK